MTASSVGACSPPETHSPDPTAATTTSACGEEAWHDVPAGPAVWVEAGAEAGDGSEALPFGTIGEGVLAGGVVRVKAGVYRESVLLGAQQDGIHLAGECSAVVKLDGGGDLEVDLLTLAGAGGETFTVSGLTLGDAGRGVVALGGDLTAWDLQVTGNGKGIRAGEDGYPVGHLDLSDIRVAEGRDEEAEGLYGYGLRVGRGYSATVRGSTFEDLGAFALAAIDAPADGAWTILAKDTVVRGLRKVEWDDTLGQAVAAESDARLRMEGGEIADNWLYGVTAIGEAVVELDAVTISGTRTLDRMEAGGPGGGSGISASGESLTTCDDCTLDNNECVSVEATDGATLTLAGATTITGTRPCVDGSGGDGVQVAGATLVADGATLDGNSSTGVFASEGSSVELVNVTIRRTAADDQGIGWGLWVEGGSSLSCTGCWVHQATGVGVHVRDEHSSVIMNDSSVTDTLAAEGGETAGTGFGVSVTTGGYAALNDVTVDGAVLTGVSVDGAGTTLEMTDCVVRDVAEYTDGDTTASTGVFVNDLATATITGGEVTAAETGIVAASESKHGRDSAHGASVRLSGTWIHDLTGEVAAGIVASGGIVHGEDVTVERVEGLGVMSIHQGSLTLAGSEVADVQPLPKDMVGDDECVAGWGAAASTGSTLALRDTAVRGSPGVGVGAYDSGTYLELSDLSVAGSLCPYNSGWAFGLAVVDGAELVMDGGSVTDVEGIGVFVSGPTSVTDVLVEDVRRDAEHAVGQGVLVVNAFPLTASGLVVQGVEGPGLTVGYEGSATCSGCTFSDLGYAGAQVTNGSLTLDAGTTICGTAPDAELGGGAGVLAVEGVDPTSLLLEGVEVCAHPVGAVFVSGGGAFVVRDSLLAGSTDAAATVGPWGNALVSVAGIDEFAWIPGTGTWDGTSGLLVEDTRIEGATDAGAFLSASTGTFCGVEFAGNGVDVEQQAWDGVSEPVDCEGVAIEVNHPEYDRRFSFQDPQIEYIEPPVLGRD